MSSYEEANLATEETNAIFLDVTPTMLKQLKKKSCDPNIVIGEKLSSMGMHSTLQEACISGNCKYVAKIIPLHNTDAYRPENPCLNQAENIENEFAIAQIMSDAGLGPKIYDICFTNDIAMMVMERYEGTLSELLSTLRDKRELDKLDDILRQLKEIVGRMHDLGIFHRDIHTDNFLYKQVDDGRFHIVLSDYGLSLLSPSKNLVNAMKIDLTGLDMIQELISKIKEGNYQGTAENMKNDTFSFELGNYQFSRDGQPCDEWA